MELNFLYNVDNKKYKQIIFMISYIAINTIKKEMM